MDDGDLVLKHLARDFRQMLRFIFTSGILIGVATHYATSAESTHELISEEPSVEHFSTVHIEAVDAETDEPVPVRAVATDPIRQHLDGSGRGVYDDGRFFADGAFTLTTSPGEVEFLITHGPDYVPLSFSLDVRPQRALSVKAKMRRWFSPEKRGWYAGDNHVHAQHDRNAKVKTDLRYAALQARAAGLSFVTEAGSNVSYEEIDTLNTPDFLLRYAPEIRPGPFVGHLNTPGINSPIPDGLFRSLVRRPLPAQAVFEAVRKRGGVVTHTHPMTPVHQLHWMGAAESYCDAVLQNCADLFDVDAKHTQQLWFAMLNLENQVGVSSYTDSALGRTNTLSPGDRRLYCRAETFEYAAIVDAMRRGRTMASNGGPIYAFLVIEGSQPGDVVSVAKDSVLAELEVHCLNELREVELHQNGRRVAAFNVNGQKGALQLSRRIALPRDRSSWVVARAEDENGKWCLTSPVYFRPDNPGADRIDSQAWTILLEVNNATRFVQLRPQYFAHLMVTIRAGDALAEIVLLRNGKPVRSFRPNEGDGTHEGRIPVTEINGEYGPGWVFYPDSETPQHFQADWPIALSGWYSVRALSGSGRIYRSDEMLYEAGNPASHNLSIVKLQGPGTMLSLWGYGEDKPVAELRPPFDVGEWWYPQNVYWRLVSQFGEQRNVFGWPRSQPVERFREAN